MQLDLFNSFRINADTNGVIFYYQGVISQNVIATMADALRQRIETLDNSGVKSKKLFSSFIEMIQNALHYSHTVNGKPEEKIAAILIGKNDSKYFIICGNSIENQYQQRVQEKIESIRNMTVDEIKKAYREQLKKDDAEHDELSKGAGLGLLTIARDASEPIEYFVTPADNSESSLAHFYLKATI